MGLRIRSVAPLAVLLALAALHGASASAAGGEEPTLSISDVTRAEEDGGVGHITFTVHLSAPRGQSTNVQLQTGDDPGGSRRATAGTGSCSAGEDYISASSGVTIPAGATSADFEDVNVCGDTLDEFDETFAVNITSSNPSVPIADGRGIGTITNDDELPRLDIDSVTLFEGNAGTTNAVLEVELDDPSGREVTVRPELSAGSAAGGAGCGGNADFINTQPASLTFAVGQTIRTVSVPVCGDLTAEASPDPQTFFVDLRNPEFATIGTGRGTGRITDDDVAPVISIGNVSGPEGNRFLFPFSHDIHFPVTLSRAFGADLTVRYSTANGTARFGKCSVNSSGDFIPATGRTLTIPARSTTAEISITVCHDNLAESDETFRVNLSSPSAGTIGTGTATGTIVNDDPGAGTFVLRRAPASVRARDGVTYTLKWSVPKPRVWRDLRWVDLRLRDGAETAIWARWDQRTNSLREVKSEGRTRLATLNLAQSRVEGRGRSVTLTLDLDFKPQARRHTLNVEVAAQDDRGHRDAWREAGKLRVR